jgi:hypothetical protein
VSNTLALPRELASVTNQPNDEMSPTWESSRKITAATTKNTNIVKYSGWFMDLAHRLMAENRR